MISEHQKEQLKKLRNLEKGAYQDASIYTVLLDLIEGNGASEVLSVFDMVIDDMLDVPKMESDD